ncbi:hypothetical protein G3820_005471, partial [Escherichia coli]|nr:hypothetical protein [Escherichia coli]
MNSITKVSLGSALISSKSLTLYPILLIMLIMVSDFHHKGVPGRKPGFFRYPSSMETTFVLDALEQALWARQPSGTVH